MNHRHRFILLACGVLALMASAFSVKVGDPAPGFTSVDSTGKQQRLSDTRPRAWTRRPRARSCSG